MPATIAPIVNEFIRFLLVEERRRAADRRTPQNHEPDACDFLQVRRRSRDSDLKKTTG